MRSSRDRQAPSKSCSALQLRTISLAPKVAFLSLVVSHAWAQQPSQPRHDVVIVTGVYEPIPLEEADRPVLSLDVSGQELLSNSLVDFLRLDPSLDLQERAPNGGQTDV